MVSEEVEGEGDADNLVRRPEDEGPASGIGSVGLVIVVDSCSCRSFLDIVVSDSDSRLVPVHSH